jgi:hypothetical protein
VVRTVVLAAVAALTLGAPAPAVASVANPVPDRVVPAPGRTPWVERLVAQACPELAPTTRAGMVRRLAAVSSDESVLVTGLRRTCSTTRTRIAERLRAGPEPGCAQVCPEVLRTTVGTARENAVAPAGPIPWTGGATGCALPDPTGGSGCVTGATRHGIEAVVAAFGPLGNGPTFHAADCWDAHAWNPHSDHSRGRACDLFPGIAGTLPNDEQRAAGWRVADYLRAQAGPLHVSYLIWQGRYWDPSVADTGGWGKPYTSTVYDTSDVTGGHFDHVHVSFAE